MLNQRVFYLPCMAFWYNCYNLWITAAVVVVRNTERSLKGRWTPGWQSKPLSDFQKQLFCNKWTTKHVICPWQSCKFNFCHHLAVPLSIHYCSLFLPSLSPTPVIPISHSMNAEMPHSGPLGLPYLIIGPLSSSLQSNWYCFLLVTYFHGWADSILSYRCNMIE